MSAQTATTAQHKVMILSGDTLVTIEHGDDKNTCTVKIGDRTLSERQATDVCARKERTISFTRGGGAFMELDGVRSRLRALSDSAGSLARLSELQRDQERLFSELARREALTTEGTREAFARLRESNPEAGMFGSLLRAAQGSIIGVSIDPRPRETDRWGAYVAGVTPNYPADKAGIRVGDIITRIDGQSVTSGRTERSATNEESLVWLRLSEIVRKLEPGKAVDLEYRRNDRTERTRVTPVDDNRFFASTMVPSQSGSYTVTVPDGNVTRFMPAAPSATPFPPGQRTLSVAPSFSGSNYYFNVAGAIANLELAPMNEKLGSYFGTSRGVLVISAPEEKNLGLEPGDVITAVDGRTVETPGELVRVLRTYDKDRQFTMQVMRQKRQQSISTSLP
jgi:hypothetical protein